MASLCRSVLKSCLAQFVRLDSCGNPVVGAASKLTTKGYISIAATAQIEAGQEFIQKNACGDLCINERDCDQFKRYDLVMRFCLVDPELLELISNARLLVDGDGDSRGFAQGSGSACDCFSLELWNPITPSNCDESATQEWFYVAFPWVCGGTIGDLTFEEGPLTLTVSAQTKGAGSTWGQGPSCVLPADSPAESTDHLIGYVTTVQPPDPVCGLQAVAAPDLVCA